MQCLPESLHSTNPACPSPKQSSKTELRWSGSVGRSSGQGSAAKASRSPPSAWSNASASASHRVNACLQSPSWGLPAGGSKHGSPRSGRSSSCTAGTSKAHRQGSEPSSHASRLTHTQTPSQGRLQPRSPAWGSDQDLPTSIPSAATSQEKALFPEPVGAEAASAVMRCAGASPTQEPCSPEGAEVESLPLASHKQIQPHLLLVLPQGDVDGVAAAALNVQEQGSERALAPSSPSLEASNCSLDGSQLSEVRATGPVPPLLPV